jgi:5-methylcytosine-specific restriction protein A
MPSRAPVHRPNRAAPRDDAEAARKAALDARRGSSAERGYDAAWRRCRAAFLKAHPLCQCDDCAAGALRVTPATVVDHLVAVAEAPERRLDWSNLRAMAKRCHDRRTAREQGFARGRRRG